MNVIDPGHMYDLDTLDGDGSRVRLTFVKREGRDYPGNKGSYAGTTMQEVLRALIERCLYVDRQKPCCETEAACELLKAAIVLLELRAARRHGRALDAASVEDVVDGNTCIKCGHVGCEKHKDSHETTDT